MKKGGMPGSPARPPRAKYCAWGEPKIGAGGKPVMKLDMVAPAAGPSVVMYAIGCFRRAALDITQCVGSLGDEACWLSGYGF